MPILPAKEKRKTSGRLTLCQETLSARGVFQSCRGVSECVLFLLIIPAPHRQTPYGIDSRPELTAQRRDFDMEVLSRRCWFLRSRNSASLKHFRRRPIFLFV